MGRGTKDSTVNLIRIQYITLQSSQVSNRIFILILEAPPTRQMARVSDAPAPVALQDLRIVVRHDHLGAKRRVDDAVVDGNGVVYDGFDMIVCGGGTRRARYVHGCPYHILDQNSAVFEDLHNSLYVLVPVHQVHEGAIDDLFDHLIIYSRELTIVDPETPIYHKTELKLKQTAQVRLKLGELYVHSAGGLARCARRVHSWSLE